MADQDIQTVAADLTHKIGADLHDIARVKSNVADMVRQGAPEIDIDSYIKSEGASVDAIKQLDQKSIGKYVDDIGRSLALGATFGFADKMAAGLDTLTRGGTYEENLKKQQAQTSDVPSAISIPGEMAGAVASAVAGGPIVRVAGEALPAVTNAASKIPSVVKAMAGGAALGGVAGSDAGDSATGAAIGAGTGAATGGVLSLAGKLFGAAGDKIMTSVIRPTARDIADGFSLDTIKKFNIGGSLNATYQKTQQLLGDLSSQLRDKLAASKSTINLSEIVEQTKNELSGAGKLKGFGANQKINSAIDSLSQEVSIVGDKLSIPDAQVVKQASGAFGAWQYGHVDPESRASEVVFNAFYNKLKEAIEKASPVGVKEINQDISKLIPVNNALIRRIPVADRNYMLSLSDMIGLAASTMHPGGMVLTGMNMAQKSGAVGNALSKLDPALQKIAPALSVLAGFAAPRLGDSPLQ